MFTAKKQSQFKVNPEASLGQVLLAAVISVVN